MKMIGQTIVLVNCQIEHCDWTGRKLRKSFSVSFFVLLTRNETVVTMIKTAILVILSIILLSKSLDSAAIAEHKVKSPEKEAAKLAAKQIWKATKPFVKSAVKAAAATNPALGAALAMGKAASDGIKSSQKKQINASKSSNGSKTEHQVDPPPKSSHESTLLDDQANQFIHAVNTHNPQSKDQIIVQKETEAGTSPTCSKGFKTVRAILELQIPK